MNTDDDATSRLYAEWFEKIEAQPVDKHKKKFILRLKFSSDNQTK